MRISNAMMAENIKGYLFKQTKLLLRTQEQIASGKRINRPSDDPIGMGQAMGYRNTIAKLQQFNSNINDAKFHIKLVEDVLNNVTELLKDAKDIAADPQPSMRDRWADEVQTIREQVLQMVNTRNNGKFIFSGNLVNTPPFDANTYAYQGDGGTKDVNISEGLSISLEMDGSAIFGTIFDTLTNLEADLRNNNVNGISSRQAEFDDIINILNTTRAVNGGQYKRLEATESFNDRFRLNAENLLSRTEDTDIAAAAIDLKIQQTALESTLATAAKIIQPSLINFLK